MLRDPRHLVTASRATAAAHLTTSLAARPRWPPAVHATPAVYRFDLFTDRLLLAWGLVGMLAHLWLQASVPPV
jgi:hypothetical protein